MLGLKYIRFLMCFLVVGSFILTIKKDFQNN